MKEVIVSRMLIFIVLLMNLSWESLYCQTPITVQKDKCIKIWIEAEDGKIDAPMKIWKDNLASGGQFIEVSGGNGSEDVAPENGNISYAFHLDHAGSYNVWGRVIASMDDEDAFWIQMDDGPWIMWRDIAISCKWHWDQVHDHLNKNTVVSFNLSKGDHLLKVAYLLDQTRLDKLLVTNDLNFKPIDEGPGAKAQMDFQPEKTIAQSVVHFDASSSFSSEGSIEKYKWTMNSMVLSEKKSFDYAFEKPDSYQIELQIIDEHGNQAQTTRDIRIYKDEPIVKFSAIPDHIKNAEEVSFDASESFVPSGKIKAYKWDFGDGKNGKGMHVKHSYKSTGNYTTSLTISTKSGKGVTKKKRITVIPDQAKKVIFETDMCLDVDDVGALATLHALANNGEAEILAVCFNEVHPYGAPAIDAINTWYGRGSIPIGIFKGSFSSPDYSPYLEAVSHLANDIQRSEVPDALDVYREVLKNQEDKSVTIISVGFLNNLSKLLREEPDLVRDKVKELVIMAGVHNDGFNLIRHELSKESEYVLEHWPSPVVISQPGGSILTGEAMENTVRENPVRESYYKFFHDSFCGRPSWDHIAVLYAVRGLSDYFEMEDSGSGRLINGYVFEMKEGKLTYIKKALPNIEYELLLDRLMVQPSITK